MSEANQVEIETQVVQQSVALVVPSYQAVRELIQGERESIIIGAPKAATEEGLDMQQSLQTYVMFQSFDHETGRLESVQFQIVDQDEQGQETNNGGTGVIFGGFVEESDIDGLGRSVAGEDGIVRRELTLEEFSVGLTNVALKVAFEKLGVSVPATISKENVSLFSVPPREEETRDSLVVYATVPVTKEQLTALLESKDFDKTVYNKIGLLGVSIGDLVCSFNLERAITQFITAMTEQHGLDSLSCSVLRFLTIQSINEVVGPIKYSDLLPALRNARARALAESEAAALAAKEKPADVATEADPA